MFTKASRCSSRDIATKQLPEQSIGLRAEGSLRTQDDGSDTCDETGPSPSPSPAGDLTVLSKVTDIGPRTRTSGRHMHGSPHSRDTDTPFTHGGGAGAALGADWYPLPPQRRPDVSLRGRHLTHLPRNYPVCFRRL